MLDFMAFQLANFTCIAYGSLTYRFDDRLRTAYLRWALTGGVKVTPAVTPHALQLRPRVAQTVTTTAIRRMHVTLVHCH